MIKTLTALCCLVTTCSLVVVPGRLVIDNELSVIDENDAAVRNGTCQAEPPAVVLHLRRHGMCNRLRTMAALAMIAEDVGLSALHVSWEAETSCNARFVDLFVAGQGVIPIEPSGAQTAPTSAEAAAYLQPFASGRIQERSSRLLSAAAAELAVRSVNRFPSDGSIVPESLATHAKATGRSVRSDIAMLSSSGTTHVLVHSSFAFMRVVHLYRLIRSSQAKVHVQPPVAEPARSPHDASTSIGEYVAAFDGGRPPAAAAAHAPVADAPGAPALNTSCPRSGNRGRQLMVHVTSDTPNVPPYLPCATFFARKGRFYRSLVPVPAVTAAVCLVWRQLAPQAAIAPGCVQLLAILGLPGLDSIHDHDHAHGSAGSGEAAGPSWPPHPLQHRLPRTASSPVLGLHVRVHDPAHDYAVVPGPGGQAEFGSQYASSLHAFANHAARLQVAQPAARVFLATNDCSGHVRATIAAGLRPGSVLTAADALAAALAELPADGPGAQTGAHTPADAHGNASLAQLRESLRRDLADIAAAFCAGARDGGSARGRGAADAQASLVDFLLLSQADLILGSYWSSFTEEAAAVHAAHLLTLARGSVLTMVPSIDGGGWSAADYGRQWEEVEAQLSAADSREQRQRQGAAVAGDGRIALGSISNASSLAFRSRRPPLGRHTLPPPLQSSATCGYPAFINRRSMEKLKFGGELLAAKRRQRQRQQQEEAVLQGAAAQSQPTAAGATGSGRDAAATIEAVVEPGLLEILDPELDALIESELPAAATRSSIPGGAAAAAPPGGAHETSWLSVPVGVASALRGRFRSHPKRALLSGEEIDQASTIVFETRECHTPTALAIRQRWGLDEQPAAHGGAGPNAKALPHVPIYCVTE